MTLMTVGQSLESFSEEPMGWPRCYCTCSRCGIREIWRVRPDTHWETHFCVDCVIEHGEEVAAIIAERKGAP